MHRPLTKLVTLFSLALVTLVASQAKADEYDHIDRYAKKIQSKARVLLRETVHYRHTSQYGRLVACTNELYRLATHIHDVTHFEGNLIHLRSDLRDLDREFHDLERLFDRIEQTAAYGYGHIHGNTSHVKRLLNSIEDSIHHIQDDVDSLLRRVTCDRPVVVNRPVYVPVRPVVNVGYDRPCHYQNQGRPYGGHGYSRGASYGYRNHSSSIGFSIGGGSSKIHFRF
ncbi:MAG: hypothetical protein P8J27_17400 [Mariniblastus sp.]|nr:hypothetical protein [Mariniblastus sp.]